jgi:hypothetical protein
MKKIIAVCGALILAACTPASNDRFGVYADGANYIVVNHDKPVIYFSEDAHPEPDALLQDTLNGKGFGFTTWRNKASCGLKDAKGNVFLLPRNAREMTKDGVHYQVQPTPKATLEANGGAEPTLRVIAAFRDEKPILAYGYDEALGIRFIDRFNERGDFEARIVLENGVGLLGHCRGFSLEDYRA